jgi:hypothetical protein
MEQRLVTVEADCTAGQLQVFAEDIAEGLGSSVSSGRYATVDTGLVYAQRLIEDLRLAGIDAWIK